MRKFDRLEPAGMVRRRNAGGVAASKAEYRHRDYRFARTQQETSLGNTDWDEKRADIPPRDLLPKPPVISETHKAWRAAQSKAKAR